MRIARQNSTEERSRLRREHFRESPILLMMPPPTSAPHWYAANSKVMMMVLTWMMEWKRANQTDHHCEPATLVRKQRGIREATADPSERARQ